MVKIAAVMIEKDWSVRDAERWAKGKQYSKKSSKIQDPNETAAADKLRLMLGAKVEIRSKAKGMGEIRIYYHDQEELMRLYSILTEEKSDSNFSGAKP
jgi:uncharacterized membrane protein